MSRSMRIISVMLVLTLCLLTIACENLSQKNYNKDNAQLKKLRVEGDIP
jgi:hypothetical protein